MLGKLILLILLLAVAAAGVHVYQVMHRCKEGDGGLLCKLWHKMPSV